MHRRNFVKFCAMGLASAGLGPAAVASAASGDLPKFGGNYRGFRRRIGSWFYVYAGEWQQIQLVEATWLPSSPEVTQFTVLFRGTTSFELEEGTYTMETDQGESIEIFIQPAGDSGTSRYYRAPFAKLRSTTS